MREVYASNSEWTLSQADKNANLDSYRCHQSAANAQYIYDYFKEKGWSNPAIFGLLGNTTHESYNNPGFHERGGKGFGIVQWTPAREYKDFARSRGYPFGSDYSNPLAYLKGQCECIDYEFTTGQQWIPTREYPISWPQYIHRTDMTPSTAAAIFCWCYERPARRTAALNKRRDHAQWWNAHLLTDVRDSTYVGTSVIKRAVDWAVSTAEDPTHGYTQDLNKRWGPYDYDCSSFVISAYRQAGLSLSGANTTHDMREPFLAEGFDDVTGYVDRYSCEGMNAGDVLLNYAHHAAMYIGAGKIVQASISESGRIGVFAGDQTGTEIWIRNYYNFPWNCVLRFNEPYGYNSGAGANGVAVVRAIPTYGYDWTKDVNRN